MNWLRRAKEKRKNISMEELKALSWESINREALQRDAKTARYVEEVRRKLARGQFKTEKGYLVMRLFGLGHREANDVRDALRREGFQEVDYDGVEFVGKIFRIKP